MSKICIRINLRGKLIREAVFSFCLLLLSAPSFSLVVNSTADNTNTNPGDGICDEGSDNYTLRAAIKQANALAGMAGTLAPSWQPMGSILFH